METGSYSISVNLSYLDNPVMGPNFTFKVMSQQICSIINSPLRPLFLIKLIPQVGAKAGVKTGAKAGAKGKVRGLGQGI